MRALFYRRPSLLLFGLLALCVASPAAMAQTAALWSDVEAAGLDAAQATSSDAVTARIVPTSFRALRLDRSGMAEALARAPRETKPGGVAGGFVLDLPRPDGGFASFRVVEAPVVAPGLQVRFPQFRSYVGQGIDRPHATVRISDTPTGFRAHVRAPEGAFLIDPVAAGDVVHHMVYRAADYEVSEARLREAFADEVVRSRSDTEKRFESAAQRRAGNGLVNGSLLRTYRLALAATGEYTAFHSGRNGNEPNVQDALEAMIVAMTRVNGIYERDLAIRMELIDDTDQIIYTDGAEDPYSNSNPELMINENRTNLNEVLGVEAYDIGHVFSTRGGGLAFIGVVCTSSKASGVTGLTDPINDLFYVDYVAHEIGHQFSADHTFNGTSVSCGGSGQRAGSTAVEPGSGSTIMAYAGICGLDNIERADGTTQIRSDDYFHNVSLNEIVDFVTNGSGSTCGSAIETGNTPPEVEAEGDFVIPVQTPFVLTGTGVDAETPGALTYTWEAVDLGTGGAPPGRDGWAEDAPFFRSFGPTAEPTRYFPQLDRLLDGEAPVVGEGLPLNEQTLRFRLTARDNEANGGGIADTEVTVRTIASAGPFVVTAPNAEGLIVQAGGDLDVTWDVAGTDADEVDTPTVDILYSEDGGATFITLLGATANDGSATVALPEAETDQGRIMVRGTGNIFFDVNDEPFNVSFTVASEAQPDALARTLGAVYPNPVGARTHRARFSLTTARAEVVRVAVYDALGREVMLLHEGLLGSGSPSLGLDAAPLAGGVYFVRAVGETFTDVRAFTVVH